MEELIGLNEVSNHSTSDRGEKEIGQKKCCWVRTGCDFASFFSHNTQHIKNASSRTTTHCMVPCHCTTTPRPLHHTPSNTPLHPALRHYTATHAPPHTPSTRTVHTHTPPPPQVLGAASVPDLSDIETHPGMDDAAGRAAAERIALAIGVSALKTPIRDIKGLVDLLYSSVGMTHEVIDAAHKA